MTRAYRASLLLSACVLGLTAARPASAQQKGHYIPGFSGLGNGSQAPPSITLVMPVYFYTTDTLKDDDSATKAAHPRINSAFLAPGVSWVTNVKILGANLGGSLLPVNFMSARIEGNSLDVSTGLRYTDLYFQPLQLGWHKPRQDFVVGYGVFMPTGKWELGGKENGGLGMWSHELQAGATFRLDEKRAWSFSTLASYEIHSHKKDTNVKVGDILTLEGGIGKSSYKKVEGTPIPRITNVGIVYYGQFKITADNGALPAPFGTSTTKDQVFGLGLEGNVFLPKQKLLLGLRVAPEFGAKNRTQGWTFLLTLAYQAKSLAKAAE